MVPHLFAASTELSPFYRRCINALNNVHIPLRFIYLNTFITDKLQLSINSAALLNISAVISSHIQGASIYKDVKYNVITIPLCSVGNIY